MRALVSPAQQNHDCLADLPEIDAIPWPTVNSKLTDALTDSGAVTEVSPPDLRNFGVNGGYALLVLQAVQPFLLRLVFILGLIDLNIPRLRLHG